MIKYAIVHPKSFAMVIINNLHNNHIHINNLKAQPDSFSALPGWQQKLHELIQYYNEHTPPKQLGRSLRTYILLQVAEMKSPSPEWEDLMHFYRHAGVDR